MIQIHAHTTSGSNDAKSSSFGRRVPPPVLQIGRRLPYSQTYLNEELVWTILRVSFAMQPGLRRRQYRLQRRNVHHAFELKHLLNSSLIFDKVKQNAPISQVTQPSLHPISSTRAPLNRPLRVISRSELKFVKK
jgi:hypothetical protein